MHNNVKLVTKMNRNVRVKVAIGKRNRYHTKNGMSLSRNRLHIQLKLHLRWLALCILVAGLVGFSVSVSSAQSVAIPAADTALVNGDYDTAVTEYAAAVNDPALKCDALYGLGTAHYRAKRYTEAANSFAQNLNECTRTFRAFVMYGQALQELGRAPEALASYQAAQAISPVLDSYLYERMAGLSPDQSVQFLRMAADGARQPEGKFALREKLAQVYMLVGSPEAALTEYDNLLLSHADRTRVVPAAYKGRTWKGNRPYCVFLLDGFLAGVWRLEEDPKGGGAVFTIEPFGRRPGHAQREELVREAERMVACIAETSGSPSFPSSSVSSPPSSSSCDIRFGSVIDG